MIGSQDALPHPGRADLLTSRAVEVAEIRVHQREVVNERRNPLVLGTERRLCQLQRARKLFPRVRICARREVHVGEIVPEGCELRMPRSQALLGDGQRTRGLNTGLGHLAEIGQCPREHTECVCHLRVIGSERLPGDRQRAQRGSLGVGELTLEPELQGQQVECAHLRGARLQRPGPDGEGTIERRSRLSIVPLSLQRSGKGFESTRRPVVAEGGFTLSDAKAALQDRQGAAVQPRLGVDQAKYVEGNRRLEMVRSERLLPDGHGFLEQPGRARILTAVGQHPPEVDEPGCQKVGAKGVGAALPADVLFGEVQRLGESRVAVHVERTDQRVGRLRVFERGGATRRARVDKLPARQRLGTLVVAGVDERVDPGEAYRWDVPVTRREDRDADDHDEGDGNRAESGSHSSFACRGGPVAEAGLRTQRSTDIFGRMRGTRLFGVSGTDSVDSISRLETAPPPRSPSAAMFDSALCLDVPPLEEPPFGVGAIGATMATIRKPPI